MAASFRCKVVTPTAALLDESVTYANVPLWDGLAGFLPGRAPLLAQLGTGELRLDIADSKQGKGGSRSYAVSGGFAKMSADGLTILAERAVPAEEIVTADAEAQLREAEAKNLPAEKQWAKVRLSVAKSGKGI